MIIHNINMFPRGVNFYSDLKELSQWDIEKIEEEDAGIDEIWYYYVNGGYDGGGQLLLRKGDKYHLHDMGHCSCYGPTDRLNIQWCDFDELKARCSEGLMKQAIDLFDAADKSR